MSHPVGSNTEHCSGNKKSHQQPCTAQVWGQPQEKWVSPSDSFNVMPFLSGGGLEEGKTLLQSLDLSLKTKATQPQRQYPL